MELVCFLKTFFENKNNSETFLKHIKNIFLVLKVAKKAKQVSWETGDELGSHLNLEISGTENLN